MKKEMTRRKALWIIRISVAVAICSIIILFSIIIAQTVKISRLENEINNSNKTYQSQVTTE